MTQILFENDTKLTRELLVNSQIKFIQIKNRKEDKKARIIGFIMIAIAAWGLFNIDKPIDYLSVSLSVFFFIVGAVAICTTEKKFRRKALLRKSKNFEEVEIHYSFYEDKFIIEQSMAKTEIQYGLLDDIIETEASYYLTVKENFYIVEKSSFTNNDNEKFLLFLLSNFQNIYRKV